MHKLWCSYGGYWLPNQIESARIEKCYQRLPTERGMSSNLCLTLQL